MNPNSQILGWLLICVPSRSFTLAWHMHSHPLFLPFASLVEVHWLDCSFCYLLALDYEVTLHRLAFLEK